MKINMKYNGLFSAAALVISLALVVSCKQADAQSQTQTSTEAGDSSTIAQKKSEQAEAPSKASASKAGNTKTKTAAKKPAAPKKPAKKEIKVAKAKVPSEKAPAPKKKAAAPAPIKVAAAPPPAKPKAKVMKKTKPSYGPDDARSSIYLSVTGKMAGRGDPGGAVSEAYRIGMGDHPDALASASLPKDKFGLIDWIALSDQKIINPKDSLKAGAPVIPPFDMNVLIESKGDFVNDVNFPHKQHTYWLKCENCHTGIFIMAKGKNNMTMQGITKGKWCGRCHGIVSFPLTDCARCHDTPKKGQPPAAAKK